MIKLIIVGILFVISNILQAQIIKSDLRILYVGGSADVATGFGANPKPEIVQKSTAERIAAFEQMLNQYFQIVKIIDAKDYVPTMSEEYDVTIFDGKPRELMPGVRKTDAQGRVVKYVQPEYLPQTFDRPAIMLAEMGETLGRSIGLKTDWYCLCLDADAHHFRREHPIFHGPFPVEMTIKMKPTPADAFHYAYFSDTPIPDSIPMWEVQTKGYRAEREFRIGMVARPWGFEDSPDAEYISSGVCAKTLDAVAIGRHGNFLHWGFASSPKYMTEEAKTVFANAIVYISRFAGQTPIARKYNDRIATREYLKELKYTCTHKAWLNFVKMYEEFDKESKIRQKEAQEKQAKGEELSKFEEMALNYKTPDPVSFENYLKINQNEAFKKFATDEQAYLNYYNTNQDYFYGGEGMYTMIIDEDVKSWGIPNNDIRLLEKAISMWEKGLETEKAKRILSRYTLCRFTTPKEWRDWYETNKSLIFFTESGGWLFMVNSYDSQIPGNDYHFRDQKLTQEEDMLTDDNNPVQVTMKIEKIANGNKMLVIHMKIHPGYHTYAIVAETDPFIPTTLKFSLPEGWSLSKKMQCSSFRQFNEAGTTIYEKEAIFQQEIKGKGQGEIKCTISYQCCDNHICFPPTEKNLSVQIN